MKNDTYELLILLVAIFSGIMFIITFNDYSLAMFIMFGIWSVINGITRLYKNYIMKVIINEPIGGLKK